MRIINLQPNITSPRYWRWVKHILVNTWYRHWLVGGALECIIHLLVGGQTVLRFNLCKKKSLVCFLCWRNSLCRHPAWPSQPINVMTSKLKLRQCFPVHWFVCLFLLFLLFYQHLWAIFYLNIYVRDWPLHYLQYFVFSHFLLLLFVYACVCMVSVKGGL